MFMTAKGTPILGLFGIFVGMKTRKIFSLLAAMAVVTGAWAQPTLSGAIDQIEGSVSDQVLAFHWDVVNATEDTLVLAATRGIVQLTSPFNLPYVQGGEGSYERFCWGPLCYPFGTMQSNTADALLVTLLPGETDTTFVGDFYPNNVSGVSAFEYCFHPPGEPALGACQTVLVCIDAAECVLSDGTLDLAPEWGWRFSSAIPADDRVALEYTLFPGVQAVFELRNLEGALVKEVSLNGGSGVMWLGTADLAEGAYIGAIRQAGEVATSKIIVAH
jgi:hypothetical protein